MTARDDIAQYAKDHGWTVATVDTHTDFYKFRVSTSLPGITMYGRYSTAGNVIGGGHAGVWCLDPREGDKSDTLRQYLAQIPKDVAAQKRQEP